MSRLLDRQTQAIHFHSYDFTVMSSNWNHPVADASGEAYAAWPTKLKFPPPPRKQEHGLLTTYRSSVLCLRELKMKGEKHGLRD